MALTKVTYSMIDGASINATDYGVAPSKTAAQNLAAFKLAVAAVPENGTLYIPASDTPYQIDITGGESAAVTITTPMTIWVDGTIETIGGAIQANPPTAFLVSGDNVKFVGSGVLKGDGTVNQVNTGTDATLPSIVKVTGDYFTMSGLTIDTPYKVGVFLYGSNNSRIVNNNFTGGPTSYQDTAYFGIRCYQGGYHIISGNHFYPSATGGMYVQCVFTSGTNACTFEDNIATKPYEKIFYLNGNDNLVLGNICYGNSGTIPGTNYVGTASDAIRCSGNRNSVKCNYLNYVGAGISSITGGTGNNFSENVIMNCGQTGISIYGGSVVLDETTVRGNVMVCGNLANTIPQDGILISAPTGTNYYLDISDNTVIGFSPTDVLANIDEWTALTTIPYLAVIKPTTPNGYYYATSGGGVTGASEPTWPTTIGNTVSDGSVTWTCRGYNVNTSAQIRVAATSAGNARAQITNNIAQDGNIGISTTYLDNSDVSNNTIGAVLWSINETNGTNIQYRNNLIELATSGSVEITGLGATSHGVGNIYNKTALTAVSTATGGVSTYTYSGTLLRCATNAYVQVTPVNAAAAAFIASHGVYAVEASPDTQISSGDGTNFAGTEQFLIQLIQ